MTLFAVVGLDQAGSEKHVFAVGPSPDIRLVDTVLLAETDTSFLGEPSGFVAAKDGSFYIADKRSATLHHYDAKGRLIRNIGRRGGGPGEWVNGPNVLTLDGDSILIVGDGARIVALSLPGGTEKWVRRKPGALTIAVKADRGRIFFNNVKPANKTTITTVRGPTEPAVDGGPYPEQLKNGSRLIAQMFSFLAVGPLGKDSIAVALQHSNYLFVGATPAGPFDSILVAPIKRRGAMPDLLSKMDEKIPATVDRVMYQPSYPDVVHRLPTSKLIAITYIDMKMESRRMTGKLTVSLVDLARRRVCSDAEVPVPTDPMPQSAFKGDTLMVVTQDEDANLVGRAVVKKFVLSAARCEWSGPAASPPPRRAQPW